MVKDFFISYSERSILAILVLSAFVVLGWLLSMLIRHFGRRKAIQRNRAYRLIAGSVNTLIIIVGSISALGTLGVNITALVASLGLTGFALGLALKDAISNLIAGLMIVIYAPFDIDDTIEVAGIRGRVADINLRYVTLRTESDFVLIPNSNFLTSIIKKVH
ncbi:MAG: mechanosensitive ion channel [Calditrichia bacterium]